MGLGWTRKSESGFPMLGYNVNPKYQNGEAKTLDRTHPQLFAKACSIAKLLAELLAKSIPPAFFYRVEMMQAYDVPSFDGAFACNFYVTKNFRTAIHMDRDEGSALALGLFLERHRSTCQQNGKTCRKNWFFVMPELQIKIPLRHGMLIIWDSARRAHGTTCDGHTSDPNGCLSDIFVVVSQLKSCHYRENERIN